MNLAIKAIAGALVVLLIALLSRTRNFYIVGTERGPADLRTTVVFGMWSIIPYFAYLVALYALAGRARIEPALLGATAVWLAVAAALVFIWARR